MRPGKKPAIMAVAGKALQWVSGEAVCEEAGLVAALMGTAVDVVEGDEERVLDDEEVDILEVEDSCLFIKHWLFLQL